MNDMATGSKRRHKKDHQPGWRGLYTDLIDGARHLILRTSTRHKRFVLAVMLLGLVLRILRMNGAVSYDEALTYTHYAGRSLGFLFSDYTYTSNHILYALLARWSMAIFGVHAWALRLPALLAGLLVMPLGYAFVRSVFNRHIAVVFLSLLAVSGPLVEYSAMARGFSHVWLFTLCGLLAARHFIKSDNMASALLIALFCGLGMWATPSMVYPAIMVYTWTALRVMANYQSTVRQRLLRLVASGMLALLLTALFYAPVIGVHSLDKLLHHPSFVDHTWKHLSDTHQDRAFDLWAYFTGTASTALAFAGFVAVGYAAYASLKYRFLIVGMLLGAVPVVLWQRDVPPPAVWTFTLLIFHLGSAIGLFFLLKVVRDKLLPGFTKEQRTLVAAVSLLILFGWAGLRGTPDPVERFPEARPAAKWLASHLAPTDRVCAQAPWEVPIGFYLAETGSSLHVLEEGPGPGGRIMALVAPAQGQTVASVLRYAGLGDQEAANLVEVDGWSRLELFMSR